MITAKEIRKKCEEDIKKLQEMCNHPKSFWVEECWAIAHFTGRSLKVCDICEKRRKTPMPKKELEKIVAEAYYHCPEKGDLFEYIAQAIRKWIREELVPKKKDERGIGAWKPEKNIGFNQCRQQILENLK